MMAIWLAAEMKYWIHEDRKDCGDRVSDVETRLVVHHRIVVHDRIPGAHPHGRTAPDICPVKRTYGETGMTP
jgi:hypothetical protein